MKSLTLLLTLLAYGVSYSQEQPPVIREYEPPAVKESTSSSVSVFDSGVTIMQNRIDPTLGGFVTGSGVCIANNDKKSLIITNRHVVDNETNVMVHHKNKQYTGTVLDRDANMDVAAVVVDVILPVAVMSYEDIPPNRQVFRNGIGSGFQVGRTKAQAPGYLTWDMQFLAEGLSQSGDSGSPYFNEEGYMVALHCGQHNNTPRGTPITPIRSWLRSKFGKEFEEVNKDKPGKPVAKPTKPAEPKKEPQPPKIKDDPKPTVTIPAVTYTLRTYVTRRGVVYSVWEPSTQCPNGICPLPTKK